MFDIVILGSGFASSLCATILARSGFKVALIDKHKHPRFSIGESSTPSADYLLHCISEKYNLPEIEPLTRFGSWRSRYPDVRCGCKRGFSYVWHGSGDGYIADSNHSCEMLVTANQSRDVADTQWYRPDVDQFLFELALSTGAVGYEQCTINHFQRDDDCWRLNGIIDGQSISIQSQFLIDGSGPRSPFMSHLEIAEETHSLKTNTASLFGHFVGGQATEDWLREQGAFVDDFPYPIDQAAVHHLFRDGWLWQIGFEDNLTSLGYVFVRGENHIDSSSDLASMQWDDLLDRHPPLRNISVKATLSGYPGAIQSIPRIQHLRATAAGPGWVALPFTAGFIDPLHSTGIAHSVSGVVRICEAMLRQPFPYVDPLLQLYSWEVRKELRVLDHLIASCYEGLVDFRLFSACAMLYFAGATTYERLHKAGRNPSFLLIHDSEYCDLVETTYKEIRRLKKDSTPLSEDSIHGFVDWLKAKLSPYNQVGLFEPEVPNMYRYTSAK